MTDIVHKLVSEMSTKFCVLEIKPELVERKSYLVLIKFEDGNIQWETGDYYPGENSFSVYLEHHNHLPYFDINDDWDIDVSSPEVVCWFSLPDPKQIETMLATKPIVEG